MIAIASSTRADWGLLTPLAAELRKSGIPYEVYASNMHLMPELGMTVKEIEVAGETPLRLDTAGAAPCDTFAETARKYGAAMSARKPDAVIILGDRYEMLAVASAAVMCGVPVIHIAGGTVSEGAIDNAIRNAISQLAALHLTETGQCALRLAGMGIDPAAIRVCGALGVYNALNQPLMKREQLEASLGVRLPDKFFVGTLHAATLDKSTPEEQMREFLDGLGLFFESHPDYGAILTYPNNDVDPARQIEMLQEYAARNPERVTLVPSLGMIRYLSAAALSEGIIGNSSSGVVEIASLGVASLDIGARQQGRERAISVMHCDQERRAIAGALAKLVSPEVKAIAARRENPYYNGDTPRIMAEAIAEMIRKTKKEEKR